MEPNSPPPRMNDRRPKYEQKLWQSANSRRTDKDSVQKTWHREAHKQYTAHEHEIRKHAVSRFSRLQFLGEATQPLRFLALLRSKVAGAVEMGHVIVVGKHVAGRVPLGLPRRRFSTRRIRRASCSCGGRCRGRGVCSGLAFTRVHAPPTASVEARRGTSELASSSTEAARGSPACWTGRRRGSVPAAGVAAHGRPCRGRGLARAS